MPIAYATRADASGTLAGGAATSHKLLKRNKAFARNQISGLLAINIDANEHFKSHSRCCAQCLQRDQD